MLTRVAAVAAQADEASKPMMTGIASAKRNLGQAAFMALLLLFAADFIVLFM